MLVDDLFPSFLFTSIAAVIRLHVYFVAALVVEDLGAARTDALLSLAVHAVQVLPPTARRVELTPALVAQELALCQLARVRLAVRTLAVTHQAQIRAEIAQTVATLSAEDNFHLRNNARLQQDVHCSYRVGTTSDAFWTTCTSTCVCFGCATAGR